jgi:hypothetical protein
MGARTTQKLKLANSERHVAATIFLVLLLGPIGILIWPILFRDSDVWKILIVGVSGLFVVALVVSVVVQTYSKHRNGLTLLALSYGVGWIALLHFIYGLWVALTGLSPTKFNQVPVPRSSSMNYINLAICFGAISAVALLVEVRRRKRAT